MKPSRSQFRSILAGLALAATILPSMAREPIPAEPTEELAATAEAPRRVSELRGRIYLGRNRPVVGATVLVRPQESRSELYLTSTDGKGLFRIGNLPEGSYRVQAEREGLAPQFKEDVSVRFPFRAVVELAMSPDESGAGSDAPVLDRTTAVAAGPVDLEARVVDVDGQPVGEVGLRLVRLDGEEDPRVVRSRPDGEIDLAALSPGSWRAEIGGVGVLSQRFLLDLRQDTRLTVIVVRQPADYRPTPSELMPREVPIAPPGLLEGPTKAEDSTPPG